MDIKDLNRLSCLDRIRMDGGPERLKGFFTDLIKSNPEKAVNLLNENAVSFSTLFTLKDSIKASDIYHRLNSRNSSALEITDGIISKDTSDMKCLSAEHRQTTHSVLKWILETGHTDDGLSNQYDEVLDIASILLTRTYKDKTFLPVIADMIFGRHRRGAFMHDLAWAFFEACDPYSLILIANYLYSGSCKNVELACKLLNFVPGLKMGNSMNYSCFFNWFRENCLFLYYTGESFQQSPNPKPYAVCVEAKYLCKAVCAAGGKMLEPLSKDEKKLMEKFKSLNQDKKVMLSNYSYRLHCQEPDLWYEWTHYPVTEQIRTAGTKTGGI